MNEHSSSRQPPKDLLLIGRVGRAHGLKGAFFVAEREAPIPRSYKELWIGANPQVAVPARLLHVGFQSGRALLQTDLASDRTGSEALTGRLIWVERHKLMQDTALKADASEGTVLFWGELIGLAVVDIQGVALGEIRDVYNSGASDVLVIKAADSALLDLPLIQAYVDFTLKEGLGPTKLPVKYLQLTVTADTFSDLWQQRPAPAK